MRWQCLFFLTRKSFFHLLRGFNSRMIPIFIRHLAQSLYTGNKAIFCFLCHRRCVFLKNSFLRIRLIRHRYQQIDMEKTLPCLLAFVAWMSNASGCPPRMSGPSSSVFLKTRYLLISNSSKIPSSWSKSRSSRVFSSTDIEDLVLLAGLEGGSETSSVTLLFCQKLTNFRLDGK